MSDVVDATDLSRRYGETVALDGVSLTVEAGEVFGLVGPNGAGKTTLIRALLGTTAAEGSVSLFGAEPTAADRNRLGFLPQEFSPPRRLTPRELLRYYGGLYDRSLAPRTVLDDVGIGGADADRPYEDLSGGQQRRTCVATALVNDPDLLVLDEPTTGIDPAGRRSLWGLIEGLAAGGTSVLLTTHSMAEARHLADRVGLLADGRLVAVDSPEALVAAHGGESRLVIEGSFDPDLAAGLASSADRTDDGLVLRDVQPRDIGDVVERIEARGATVESLTWSEPDLEDVYLALAGAEGEDDSGVGSDGRGHTGDEPCAEPVGSRHPPGGDDS
jgi:ABC-2 type transport system ATP-binding protein